MCYGKIYSIFPYLASSKCTAKMEGDTSLFGVVL